MNEMTLKLPGGGILVIHAFPETERDNVRVEFFEPGENPDTDIGHGSSMTASAFAEAVRRVVDAAPQDAETLAQYTVDEIKRRTRPEGQSPLIDAPAAETTPLDREQRLRMIAQAVEGMTYLDWKRASHQIGRMFAHPATVASNRAVIGKTLEEIADTIENERM